MNDVSAGEQGAGWIDRRTAVKTLLGFGVALLLIYLLGAVVGWDRTIDRLSRARFEWVVAACLSSLLCLVAWGKTWQIVLAAAGVHVPFRKLVVTFLAATFANYVTPMGQAGGEPFIAYVLSRDVGTSYERSLASVVTADLIRMLPFFTVGGVGLGYLLFVAGLPGPTEEFAVLLIALAVALPAVAYAGWRFRDRVESAVLRAVAPIAARTDRISVGSVRDRIEGLYEAIDRIVASPRALLAATGYAYVGWILFAAPLYFSSLAIGTSVPALLVAFLVPVSVIAGSTPLPGGLAAIEGTLVAMLTVLTGLGSSDAFAVTTVYRLTSYWFVVAVGGVASLWVIRRV